MRNEAQSGRRRGCRAVRSMLLSVALMSVTLCFAQGQDTSIKADVKRAGEAVGTAAREVGHEAKNVGTEIGHGAKKVGTEVAEGAKLLEVNLAEHIGFVISALRERADEFGLTGNK